MPLVTPMGIVPPFALHNVTSNALLEIFSSFKATRGNIHTRMHTQRERERVSAPFSLFLSFPLMCPAFPRRLPALNYTLPSPPCFPTILFFFSPSLYKNLLEEPSRTLNVFKKKRWTSRKQKKTRRWLGPINYLPQYYNPYYFL